MQNLAGLADITSIDIQYALPVSSVRAGKPTLTSRCCTHCPMQTPNMGILPAKWRIASRLMPESVRGCPGPGLMTS